MTAEMNIILLYVLCLALCFYGIRKSVQCENMRRHAELGRSYEMALQIRKGLIKKVSDAKGLTEEQFDKMWSGK